MNKFNPWAGRVDTSWSRRQFLGKGSFAAMGVMPIGASLAFADQKKTEKSFELEEGKVKTGWLWDDRFLQHFQEKGHPESPERLRAIRRQMKSSGLEKEMVPLRASVDPDPYIKLVHSNDHIKKVKEQAYDDEICRLAVSGGLSAVEAVCSGVVRNAFCAIRPPGHHAANRGEHGFCFYNNIAVAARYAQKKFGLKRILIVDWDYHHGDGTEWAFYDDPSVLFFSTHALRVFPGTGSAGRKGSGPGEGFNINVPLPRGAGDREILKAFSEILLPAAEKFKPELVLISAGFDARKDDLLGDFRVTDEGFAELTRLVMQISKRDAESRLVSFLEGGYNTQGLALGVESHVKALMEKD